LHDLRRTGRSLMSRAKVDTDHAERGHGARHLRRARDSRSLRIFRGKAQGARPLTRWRWALRRWWFLFTIKV